MDYGKIALIDIVDIDFKLRVKELLLFLTQSLITTSRHFLNS